MKPQPSERRQRSGTFAGVMRHIGRSPLLIGWGVVVIAMNVVVQHNVPQPWSGMIGSALLTCWSIPASASYLRGRARAEGVDR
ncbi:MULTISPECIES: hypothetical protein [Streptomyces]|uniref:hypothetical protein n=1 Tax=Streptomyces TaxID=1883 RepID=UPI00117ECA4B|nr:hypothetical protein [Streptomyces viridochromogenes]